MPETLPTASPRGLGEQPGLTTARMSWHRKAERLLSVTDLLVLIAAVAGAQLLRFGLARTRLLDGAGAETISYTLFSALLVLVWWAALGVGGARQAKILGAGSEEYRRVVRISLWLFAALAVLAYISRTDLARGYVILAAPLGIALLLLSRWVFRVALVAWRRRGRARIKTLLIGDLSSIAHLDRRLVEASNYGYTPVGAYPAGHELPERGLLPGTDLPLLGTDPEPEAVMAVVRERGADVVAISSGHLLTPRQLRRLGWMLAQEHVGLAMAPALTDIAGPRLQMQPLNGIPLVHVHTPRMGGGTAAVKRGMDVVLSALGLLVLAPVFLLLGLLIKADSPGGPVFFHQERIGREGRPFRMHKFRSMVPDADRLRQQLAREGAGNEVLFKMADDPRITRVGKVMRKLSLDELPQLWNVLVGEMSLVGPRPPLPEEVAAYEQDMYRRLMVKPGITGLWQVGGRSDLSWEESVRLDLYYVENWSVTGDLLILARTVKAVFAGAGAY